MTDRRRSTFGPVVLLGLAGGALAAVAAGKEQVRLEDGALESLNLAGATVSLATEGTANLPLPQALALVVLATWGVLLVTRGIVRRLVAGLGAVSAVGLLVSAVVGILDLRESYPGDTVERLGADRALADPISVEIAGWYWALLVGAVLAVAAGVLAVRLVGSWPEMGGRYDAPTGEGTAEAKPAAAPGEQSNLDLWKQIDEGHDPTA